MRIHPWLAALSSLALLIAAGESSARAQQASSTVFESGGFEDSLEGSVTLTSASSPGDQQLEVRSQSGGPPPQFQPPYGNQNPQVLWPQGTPQSYQPYPRISPFSPANVAQTTTYNRDGLWFEELLYRNRDYFMTLEYLMVRYRNPGNATVGGQPVDFFRSGPAASGGGGGGGAGGNLTGGVLGYPIDNLGLAPPALIGIVNPSNTANRLNVGPGIWPYPIINQDANFLDQSLADENMFPIRSLGFFDNPLKSDGMRARWGYDNEDGSGLMLTGWFGTEGYEKFQGGVDSINGIPLTQAVLLANTPTGGQSPVFPRYGSLPLYFRDDILSAAGGAASVLSLVGYTGVPQKYDVMFKYDYSTLAAGGSLQLYHEPIYKRKWVTVRPAFGARYQYLDEQFGFRGVDSGFGYTLNFGEAGGGGAGGQQTPQWRPSAGDINIPIDQNGVGFMLDSRLKSKIDSHMAGPEAGLRYDFGSSKNFSIWGQSTFGLLANHQRLQLDGNNIGDPRLYWLATGGVAGGTNFTDESLGVDTEFLEEETHTIASPMFEQSVFIDMAIFKYIPLLKNLHVLENANFRTGYTYTVIGGVARPGETIQWRAFPEFPTIKTNHRKTWSTHNWSFALDWEF